MGSKKNQRNQGHKKTFGRAPGMHSYKVKQNKRSKQTRNIIHGEHNLYKVKKQKDNLKLTFRKKAVKRALKYQALKDKNTNRVFLFPHRSYSDFEGNRILNLEKLKNHICEITIHSATCVSAVDLATNGHDVIQFEKETRSGFHCVLSVKCKGCGKVFCLENGTKFANTSFHDINIRAVWGSMVTGGGYSSLNEAMGTCGVPGIESRQYTKIEHTIGEFWHKVLEEEMYKAAEEEKSIAIENDEFFEGVPAVTVICDGGWSKRSHKHTYNAMAGVGVIFGLHTKKLLHIGVRNKHCHVCSVSKNKKETPKAHECFKNWSGSSQSMESDIILEGFLQCEERYGIRYMKIIADGDSSVYLNIQNHVPVWGPHVAKIECANHACKCLRSNLEKLATEKKHLKGKGGLTQKNIKRITAGVRCAIIMRSKEMADGKKNSIIKLRQDIRNAGRHVFGLHNYCSTDFCTHSTISTTPNNTTDTPTSDSTNSNNQQQDIILSQVNYWKDTIQDLDEEQIQTVRKGGSKEHVSEELLKDVYVLLNRVADKADRLIGNFTSNLAESWMRVRCKFDGGKMENKCNKGSFNARCYGAALRQLLGPAWSPSVYNKLSTKRADNIYINTYKRRSKRYIYSKKSSNKPENKKKRKERKFQNKPSERTSKDYGDKVLIDTVDISEAELKSECEQYYNNEVAKQNKEHIEQATRGQSNNTVWHEERKKRLTSSNFGEVMSRSLNNNNPTIVKRLLYSNFKGNIYTVRGLSEEDNARIEYKNFKSKTNEKVAKIEIPGLIIDERNPCLATSTDGIVTTTDGKQGLIEIKTLLQKSKKLIDTAAKTEKTFCLKYEENQISLKKNHKYFYQIQGQLNILGLQWCDLIVRRINPHDMCIIRIERDATLWENVMLPKLTAFYFTHILPELAVPRHGTASGIRKPQLPWYKEKTVLTDTTKTTKRKAQTIRGETSSPSPTPTSSDPQPSTSTAVSSKRKRSTKFLGREILHLWIEGDGTKKWYRGSVLSVVSGYDGSPNAVYQVQYEGEQETFDIDSLNEDFQDGSVKFIDI